MAMELLRTATLVDVRDGLLAHQIDAELVKIHADCLERPGLKKARKVTLEISITPPGTDDPLDGAEVEFTVKASLPATSIVRQMKSLRKRNGFAFDADTDSLDHDSAQQRLGGIDED